MSKDPIKLLRGDPPEDLAEPTDSEIEELLSLPVKVPKAEVDEGKSRFVKNLVENRQTEPVRRFEPGVSFGAWIKSVRESLPLSQQMVGTAVGRTAYFINNVEAAETPLWEMEPKDVAALMEIFGVHIQAVENALRTERPKATRAERDRPTGRDRSARQPDMTALDFGYRQSYTGPAEWLDALRRHLREQGADRLLG